MTRPAHLALIVARRQKRLKYWQEQFAAKKLDGEHARVIKEKLNTSTLLLSKLIRAESAEAISEAELRLQANERELTALFESRRLMTNVIGVAAVKDPV